MSEQSKANPWKLSLPIFIVFGVVTLLPFIAQPLLAKIKLDSMVLLVGNLILFLVTIFSFMMYRQALSAGSTPLFIRNVYGGMLLKFFVCLIAAFAYIFTVRIAVNKTGVFVLMFLYLVYTFLEMSVLMKNSKLK